MLALDFRINFALGLEPVVEVAAILSAARLVEFVRSSRDSRHARLNWLGIWSGSYRGASELTNIRSAHRFRSLFECDGWKLYWDV